MDALPAGCKTMLGSGVHAPDTAEVIQFNYRGRKRVEHGMTGIMSATAIGVDDGTVLIIETRLPDKKGDSLQPWQ